MDQFFCFLLRTKSVLRLKNRSRTGKTDDFSSPATVWYGPKYVCHMSVTVAILGKNSVMVPGPYLWMDFDVISYKFNNILWDKCVFQQCRSKVSVTDAILGKTLSWS